MDFRRWMSCQFGSLGTLLLTVELHAAPVAI